MSTNVLHEVQYKIAVLLKQRCCCVYSRFYRRLDFVERWSWSQNCKEADGRSIHDVIISQAWRDMGNFREGFRIQGPTFERMISSSMHVATERVHNLFVKDVASNYTMANLHEQNH